MRTLSSTGVPSLPQRRGVQAEAGAEGRGRAARAPTQPASPMGLRKLHRGRGGSRHFRRHRGFIPEGSLFVSLRATGYLLTIFLFCLYLSVKKMSERRDGPQDVRFTELLIGERKKSFGCKKYWKKRICYVLHISKNYCTFDGGLSYFLNDIIAFLKTEFLADLGFALVDGLQALAREHVNLLGGEVSTQ